MTEHFVNNILTFLLRANITGTVLCGFTHVMRHDIRGKDKLINRHQQDKY